MLNIIGILVLEKKIFEDFYHIWAWGPSWSCDLDHLYKLSLPLPKEASNVFGFHWPSDFKGDGYTISSPCEHDGPGELIMYI